MKKIFTFAMATLVCMSCAAKKPVAQQPAPQPVQQESETQRKIRELKEQQELEDLEAEQRLKRLERAAREAELTSDAEIAQLKASNAKNAVKKRKGQSLYIPCIDESYDKTGEYMAGLGIAEGATDLGSGTADANRYAIADITSRYIGMIKNGVSQYAKNVNTRSGQKVKENELEGAAEAIGTKVIDKYANAVCRDYEEDKMGGYTCYVAVHVPLKEVVNATVDEIGVIQTDVDREQFRKYMNAELDKQAAAKEAEKKELLEQRQMLEQ
ncbi:MAG: hypothetical protein KBT27_11510 [Prevotellaceae bacterium]|nr:hypothetical protein [Candidatus Faecinaster equi]